MLKTEMRNPKTMNLSFMNTDEMLQAMQEENLYAVEAVKKELPQIEKAVDAVAKSFENGGRLFYIGCGTSGRLGVVDAAECPPTFGVDSDMVVGIIAGGLPRMASAGEHEEDNGEQGRKDLQAQKPKKGDVVVGLSVAGGARYVLEALAYAKEIGCITASITANADSPLAQASDIPICPDTGSEVLTGSTRLKAGTAQKLVLNMISTCAMAKQGYVYENLMINLKPSNEKLRGRVIRIVRELTGKDEETAVMFLDKNDWEIRKTVEAMKAQETT